MVSVISPEWWLSPHICNRLIVGFEGCYHRRQGIPVDHNILILIEIAFGGAIGKLSQFSGGAEFLRYPDENFCAPRSVTELITKSSVADIG